MINCTSSESIILKTPSTVDIPVEEYKSLVRSEQLVELTKRVLTRCARYTVSDTLELLYTSDKELEERARKRELLRKAENNKPINDAVEAVADDQNKEETKSESESE